MVRLVRANYRGRVPQRVARTSRTMTNVEWQYVNVNGDWYDAGQSGEQKQKFNAKAPGRPRTAKTACMHSHCRTLLATISHPNRQPVFNLESWRSFFASSRLGVAP
jgi:hypothetical protein